MFLARISLKNANDRDTFNLKYDLRRLFARDRILRHFIMGTVVKGQRVASKVNVSRPYSDGLIRVWGWIPVESNTYVNGWSQDRILQTIYSHLGNPKGPYSLEIWREMDSLRDTVNHDQKDPLSFLKDLLQVVDTGENE